MLNKFSPTFWVASFLQLMERWAFYGIKRGYPATPRNIVASLKAMCKFKRGKKKE